MMRRNPARFPALCGMLLCALHALGAQAADRACPAANVNSDEALRERWPDLVPRVRDEVLVRDDIDACARITLRLAPDASVRVEVALPDGRTASRAGLRSEDVIPMLHALLLVPEPSLDATAPAAAAAPSAKPERAPVRPAVTARATDGPDDGSSMPTVARSGVGVELAVLSGGRVGDGQASYGLGAQSFLDVSGWLVGFGGRVDRYHEFNGAHPETALELGALAGKRIRFSGVTLDMTAGPGFAIKGAMADTEVVAASTSNGIMTPRPLPPPEPSSGPVPRLLVGVRLGFSPRSVLRTFVGADGTFGPARAVEASENSPLMPRWTLGLTLGATVGTL